MGSWQKKARDECLRASEIVAITGAGISVPSGLPSAQDIFRGRQVKELFSKSRASRHWQEYQHLYAKIIKDWRFASPNQAHLALSSRGAKVITMNLDGLHKQAGTQEVIELHGSLYRFRCLHCGIRVGSFTFNESKLACELCDGPLWPDVVLEGEPVRQLGLALHWITFADVLLIIGTSLTMQPIRMLPRVAKENGIPIIVINEKADEWVPYYLEQ